jgi:hypothetical protein
MATASQLRAGWKLMPDRRAVSYLRRIATTPTYTTYTVSDAWYRNDGSQEGGVSQGVYLKRYRRWFLVKERLALAGFSGEPVAGDAVTVATATSIDPVTGTWTVLRVAEAGALGAWELSGVLLSVQSAFAVTVTLQRRTGAKDATGRVLPTTSDAATVSGWFQVEGASADPDLLGKTQTPTRGTIYLATYTAGIRATDTLAVGGVSYNVASVADPLSLEELQSVEVELAR